MQNVSLIDATESVLTGRCPACGHDLNLCRIEGVSDFLEEYTALAVDAMLVSWEGLQDGLDGRLVYSCSTCGRIYRTGHRSGGSAKALTYKRYDPLTKKRYYESWVLEGIENG